MAKRRHGMPAVRGSEVNVTPLIDVVMCLIIFFMLVAKIGISTGAKQMDLPYSYLGLRIEDMGPTLTLNVLPIGDMQRIKHPGPDEHAALPTDAQVSALVFGVDKDLPVKTEIGGATQFPLREAIKAMKAQYKEKFKVIIRADEDLPFHLVEPVLAECSAAGASDINFTTTSQPQAGAQ